EPQPAARGGFDLEERLAVPVQLVDVARLIHGGGGHGEPARARDSKSLGRDPADGNEAGRAWLASYGEVIAPHACLGGACLVGPGRGGGLWVPKYRRDQGKRLVEIPLPIGPAMRSRRKHLGNGPDTRCPECRDRAQEAWIQCRLHRSRSLASVKGAGFPGSGGHIQQLEGRQIRGQFRRAVLGAEPGILYTQGGG